MRVDSQKLCVYPVLGALHGVSNDSKNGVRAKHLVELPGPLTVCANFKNAGKRGS